MQKTFFYTAFVFGGVLFLFSPAHVSAATNVITNITTPTTWSSAGSPYILNGNIGVSSSLTIEPGTVVKLDTSNSLFVASNGSLNASGATFTSIFDDSHGGNTDPAGNSQTPSVVINGWGAISSSGNISIQNSHFFYGGRANRAMVEVNSGSATITDNHFQYANNAYIQNNGTASVRNNTFEDIDQFAVWQIQGSITFGANSFARIVRESYLLTTDTFTNEGGNTGERVINLQNMVFNTDKTLSHDALPYQMNAVTVPVGKILTISPGTVIKFWNTPNNIINSGTIKALGTQEKPIVLTSFFDDSVGGDSNNDGSTTQGAPEQWTRIYNNPGATLELEHSTIRNGGGIAGSETGMIINHGTLQANNSVLEKSARGIINASSGQITLTRSTLQDAQELVRSRGVATVTIRNSVLLNSSGSRIANASGVSVDARENYWGNATGPVINGNPATVPSVTTNVDFGDFLTENPICTEDCFSNVLFLPGVMGSRLYETQGNEDELWFSSVDSRHERMEMNPDGTSKNDVYTKEGLDGVVDTAYGNLYSSFLNDLSIWKAEGVFNNYSVIPYDWRGSLDDIVMNGRVENGKLRYTTENSDLSQSYLYQQAKALQQNSRSEKIILIGHSNGGLVIKAFIQKLKETNDPLYNQIEKVIFVGVPQTGTPDSVVSLLYGSKIGMLWLGTSAQRARMLANNMPTMYNLLPSEKLFYQLDAPIVFSGDNTPSEWNNRYGNSINTYEEFEDFLTGGDGREHPAYSDLLTPEILSEDLFNNAQAVHQILDNWMPSPNTEVIQIAGWGLYTEAGLEVVDDKECEFDLQQLVDNRPICTAKIPSITLRDKKILDGDETVLVKSAHNMAEGDNVKKYWVDLRRYNEALNANVFSERKHKNILEVDSVPLFIKSLIEKTGINYQYILNTQPLPFVDLSYIKYQIHSPLHLTVIDNVGNKTGWDDNLKRIVENIKGAQYSEVGEIKTILIPKDTPHTVKLEAYEKGSFTLDIRELEGEQVVSETQFEAIPALEETVVEIEPPTLSTPANMMIDFNDDGTVETEIIVQSGETGEYENPEVNDTTPPEVQVTFDQTTKDIVWSASDNMDQSPKIEVTPKKVTATDKTGNTTEIPFTKYRENNTRLQVQFEKMIYNNNVAKVDKTTLFYNWQLKKDKLTDLDTDLRIKDKSRLKTEYRKVKNETKIIEKDKQERTREVTTRPGFVSVTVSTFNKNIIWEY